MSREPPDPFFTLRGNMSSVLSLLFQEETEIFYVGTSEGMVHVWELANFREVNKIKVSEEGCLAIRYNSERFITQERGGGLRIWRQESGFNWELLREIPLNYIGFCKVIASSELVICPTDQSNLIMKSLVDEGKDRELKVSTDKKLGLLMCLSYLPGKGQILAAFESGDFFLWDQKEGRQITMSKLTEDCPMCLDFCEGTGEGILGSSGDQLIKFCLLEEKISLSTRVELTNPGVGSVSIHPHGKLCAIGCWDGRIRYFSMKKLNLLAVLEHHTGQVESVLFSRKKLNCSDNVLLCAGGTDGRITLWTLYEK